jgi:hypothetical protein
VSNQHRWAHPSLLNIAATAIQRPSFTHSYELPGASLSSHERRFQKIQGGRRKVCSQNSFVFNTLTSRSLSFKKLLECLGEDWDGGNDSFVETTAPKSEADMRAWSLPEDLTEAQLCVRFLQSDKTLQQQLGVQMLARVAAHSHAQVIPLAVAKV